MAFAVHRVSSQCISFAHLFTAIRLHILAHLHLALALQIISDRFHASQVIAALGWASRSPFFSYRVDTVLAPCESVRCITASFLCASSPFSRLADQPFPVLCHLDSVRILSFPRLFCSSLSFPTPRTCDAFLCLSVSALSTLGFAVSKPSRAIPFHCNSFTS